MPTVHTAIQIFTGNPIRTQGYGLIAGSEGAQDWAPYCLSEATLGGASEEPSLWRAASDFEGIGTAWLAGSALCITRLQQMRADQHLAEIRQHLVLARKAASDLGGDASALSRHFKPFADYSEVLRLRDTSLPLLKIVPRDLSSIQHASYDALRRWFPPNGRDQVLPTLLSALFDDKGAVCVNGLPLNTQERLDFAIALMALLPPPLRFACTFATRMISSRGCHARFKFLWDGYPYPRREERLFNYAENALNFDSTPIPYFQHALQAFRAGEDAFLEFGERYLQRAVELQQYYMDARQMPFVQAAYYSLLALNEWIEQDKQPSSAHLFRLINRDKSLKPADLPLHCQNALNLALGEYTTKATYPHELIEQSADALTNQALEETVLRTLQANIAERPEATLELCRAWWNIPKAKAVLQRGTAWQKLVLEAAQTYFRVLQQSGEKRRAHQLFNRLYRESIERTGFVLDEQTASEWLGFQERAISEHSGDTPEVLETLFFSAQKRSAAELDELLNENWLSALPTELAAALKPAALAPAAQLKAPDAPETPAAPEQTDVPADAEPEPIEPLGNLGHAISVHYPKEMHALFYKLALVCIRRNQLRALSTPESLSLLVRRTRPSQRDIAFWFATAQLEEQHHPEIAYAALSQLSDQSGLMTPNSPEHFMLTAWLIDNSERRAVSFVKQGIQNAQNTLEYVARLLPHYLPYHPKGLPKVWRVLQLAKPITPDQQPADRIDFALLTQLTCEQWREVPSAVHSLASGLSEWQAQPNSLDKAMRARRAELEQWFVALLRGENADQPSVVESAQRVLAHAIRELKALIVSDRPNLSAAADRVISLLQLAPPPRPFGQSMINNISRLLAQATPEIRIAFVNLLRKRRLREIADALEENALRRRLIPDDLTPTAFAAQLESAFRTLERLQIWQDELDRHPESARRILEEWAAEQPEQLSSKYLSAYFKAYDANLQALHQLIEHGQRDGQRLLLTREDQLEMLRSGRQPPRSVLGLILHWLNRASPKKDRTETQ
jgi:hypothetical protein